MATKTEKRIRKARRKMAGTALIVGARGIEGGMAYAEDSVLVNRMALSRKEKTALDSAHDKLLEGCRILRVVGNHLANPKAKK